MWSDLTQDLIVGVGCIADVRTNSYQQMMGRRTILNFKLHAFGIVQVQQDLIIKIYWPCNLQACRCGSRPCPYNCQLLS